MRVKMEQQDNIPVEQKKLEGERYECVSELTRIRLDLLMKLNKIREKSKFGVKVGLSREYVSQLMNGRLKPTLGQAQKITGAFDIQIWDIFEPGDIRDLQIRGEKNG